MEKIKKITPWAMMAFTLVLIASTSFAAKGGMYSNPEKAFTSTQMEQNWEERKLEMQAHHEEMQKIMESGDFNTWRTFIEENAPNSQILEVINEENFAKFLEAWKLRQEAHEKMLQADEIEEGLGIKKGFGHGGMMGMGGAKEFGPKFHKHMMELPEEK